MILPLRTASNPSQFNKSTTLKYAIGTAESISPSRRYRNPHTSIPRRGTSSCLYVKVFSYALLILDSTSAPLSFTTSSSYSTKDGGLSSSSATDQQSPRRNSASSPSNGDDPLGNLLSSATTAANAFGSWFTNTANAAKERAPEFIEKTKTMSKDMYSRTKTLTLEAYDKASDAAKKASDAVEGFVEKQINERGRPSAETTEAAENMPSDPNSPQREVPLAE